MTTNSPLSIWAVSDGRAGMENQALGLAEAIARKQTSTITIKRLTVQKPFDLLPHWAWGRPEAWLTNTSDTLSPPVPNLWPDLWIATGRRTIPFSLMMKAKAKDAAKGGAPFVVQTQDPRIAETNFDLVIPPAHDMLRGPNVFPITGSPNRITQDGLVATAKQLEPALPPLPRPLATVLIGGASKDYRLTDEILEKIIAELRDVMASGIGLLVSTSRRTNAKAAEKLHAALAGPRAFVWDGKPVAGLDNPYFGMLGLASRFFVTEESANMITDAGFTGKPVHLLSLEGGAPKWTRLHEELERRGIICPSKDYTADWSYDPLRETDRAAEEVLKQMQIYHQA
ncbi:MAG: mitochondrial fission ELM1 family protein [Pseudomonadota bacterium]